MSDNPTGTSARARGIGRAVAGRRGAGRGVTRVTRQNVRERLVQDQGTHISDADNQGTEYNHTEGVDNPPDIVVELGQHSGERFNTEEVLAAYGEALVDTKQDQPPVGFHAGYIGFGAGDPGDSPPDSPQGSPISSGNGDNNLSGAFPGGGIHNRDNPGSGNAERRGMATYGFGNATNFDNDDLNGECFILGELGEIEDVQNSRLIIVPVNYPVAQNPGVKVVYTSSQADVIVKLNAFAVYNADTSVTAVEASRIGYLRFLVLREGHASPNFPVNVHHVKYNECVFDTVDIVRHTPNPRDALTPGTFPVVANLPTAFRRDFRLNYANMVSCVAYMFRVRGHHWLANMDDKYKDLWGKCLKGQDNPGLNWDKIAHHAIHAIFPDVLDDIWVVNSRNGSIAGALVKRVDSPPAGVAAIRSIYAGAMDLKMALPSIYVTFKDQYDKLQNAVDQITSNRWAGSINRKYYGAPDVNYNEQEYASMGAVVMACLESFAPDSPLLKSQSLKRVANNARITGALLTRGIATVANDPSMARNMLHITN